MKRHDLIGFAVLVVAVLTSPGVAASQGSPKEVSRAATDTEALSRTAPEETFDPRSYQDKVAGELTQVLVLGVPHLSGTPEDFDANVLEPLLERLEAYAPDLIAIENLSGESLHALQAYEALYPGMAEMFGSRFLKLAEQARSHVQIDTLPEAEVALRAALADLPEEPTPAQRRNVALLFLASGDPNSAVVQWWRLPESERKPGEELSEDLAQDLERFAESRNESRLIGARLASRRGLEQVYPMDDHSAVDKVIPIFETLSEALRSDPEVSERLDHPEYERLRTATDRLDSPEQALATIRELNKPDTGILDAYSQWLIMLDREIPQSAGRVRMATWEARNLRMAANIREVSSAVPGGRILVVVGSAHKPWLDAYLGLMTDMHVVDANAALHE